MQFSQLCSVLCALGFKSSRLFTSLHIQSIPTNMAAMTMVIVKFLCLYTSDMYILIVFVIRQSNLDPQVNAFTA